MGFLDMIKGVLGGEGVQSALESTGLADHIGAVAGEGSAAVEALGADVGAAGDALGASEILPADLVPEVPEVPDISGIADAAPSPS